MSYGASVNSGNSLLKSDWCYIFVGPAGSLGIQDTVCRSGYYNTTLEAHLVPIGEKLGGGAFTFCFIHADREYRGSGTNIEADTAGMG